MWYSGEEETERIFNQTNVVEESKVGLKKSPHMEIYDSIFESYAEEVFLRRVEEFVEYIKKEECNAIKQRAERLFSQVKQLKKEQASLSIQILTQQDKLKTVKQSGSAVIQTCDLYKRGIITSYDIYIRQTCKEADQKAAEIKKVENELNGLQKKYDSLKEEIIGKYL